MDDANLPIVDPMPLSCVECRITSDEQAKAWRTYLADDPEEPEGEPLLASYCSTCAAREFGPTPRERYMRALTP